MDPQLEVADAPRTQAAEIEPARLPSGWSSSSPFGSYRPPEIPTEWGDYVDVTQIAEGGMGLVYRARHKRLNRFEALKVIRNAQFANEWEAYRFRFEAEAAAALTHPNIVSVYGSGEVNGIPYYAMQWVDGGDLAGRLNELRKDPKAAAALMAKVARAVHHAHQQGILHRDLKPANVLIDADGEPQITDFGLAKRTDSDLSMTVTGAAVGTPQFMAPEQARGEKGLTTAVDVYGLGGILYVVLTGRPPFLGRNVADMLKRVTADPPATPRSLNPEADHDLEAICLKCLEKNPRDRYASAEALAEDLERAVRGEPVSVRPPGLKEWAMRELAKTPQPFPGYVWQVKVWFALIIIASQLAVFACAKTDAPAWSVWACFLAAWTFAGAALWKTMAAKFTRLPTTEQHSVMIALGHIVCQMVIAVTLLPWTGSARDSLAIYPAMFAIGGLAYFVVGTTHWGLFYLFGLIVTGCIPIAAAFPMAAPLLYGSTMAACMLYWAYAVKVKFAGEPAREEIDPLMTMAFNPSGGVGSSQPRS